MIIITKQIINSFILSILIFNSVYAATPFNVLTSNNINQIQIVNEDTIADQVWNEATSGHTTSGTFGEKVGKKLLTVVKFLGLK